MPLSYKNFKGDTYFLHSKVTKKGNTTYHFSKAAKGAAELREIPAGFEIYEEPNGKVYLRKKTKEYFLGDEIQVIQKGLKTHSEIKDFKLDIKKNIVYVYTAEQELPVPPQLLDKYKHYDTQMRFVLIDEDERSFEVERFCYLGGIDDWIYIDDSTDLESLVREYVQHLGQESFYDLGV
ncbi:hypothetical protein [Rossellomorea aquimaris]|uniref:Uncharacterized protein n=1 Tax=Rossellomorea aquimaris TaxID=189382 RepID=A0A5D4TLU1_9BACI|nr:hypothetical protein [Rossellomorea aquimaris]TYS75768.1 hypothetical protein FZC80_16330 [Rossellomorea aquimaris]